MSWYFSVALPADPAPCHDAAASLRSVARAARDAADFLAGQAVLPREDFDGAAAQSYRTAAAALNADSQGVAGDTHGLAEALDVYAVRIAAVRRTLTRVRDDAVAQGFHVVDDRVEWVPAPATDLDAAYQGLEARALRAHTEAEAAYADWWRAVQEHTTGPLASPTSAPAPAPAPAPVPPVPPVPPLEPRVESTRRMPPAVTAVGGSSPEPRTPTVVGHPARRTPAEVDFVPALLPMRWQPAPDLPTPPHCPTTTEGVP